MKQISIMAISLALASPASALTCQKIGDTTYCNGNGYNSTTQHVGNSDYTNENYGGQQRRTTCQTIGQFTYCN